jgi:tetratricopeptide (TPR) repeat protein
VAPGRHRTAAALAYVHYSASLDLTSARGRGAGPKRAAEERETPRERHRRGFRKWIATALELGSGDIKDLYRLGIFEAQVESFHDKAALKAFLAAIERFQAMSEAERERRHDYRKYYLRALYAAGRSALRLGQARLARKLAFECIRADPQHRFVEGVHKFTLAGKVCHATRELDAADRALRLALDAPGPRQRDYVYGLLAEVAETRGELDAAVAWIADRVPPGRRSSPLWRQLGDLERRRGQLDAAESAYQAALMRDRAGRHLTFQRLATLYRAREDLRGAERCFRQALEFRRKKYQSEDIQAVQGLAEVLELRGRKDEARALRDKAERLVRLQGRGQ